MCCVCGSQDTLGFQYPILVTFIHFGFMSLLLRSVTNVMNTTLSQLMDEGPAMQCHSLVASSQSFAFLTWFPEFPAISGTMYLRFIVPSE